MKQLKKNARRPRTLNPSDLDTVRGGLGGIPPQLPGGPILTNPLFGGGNLPSLSYNEACCW